MGTQNFFFVPRSWQDGNIFLYLFTELKTYHLSYTVYKNDAIDMANPNSMQEACFFFVPPTWQDEKYLSLFLYRPQSLQYFLF